MLSDQLASKIIRRPKLVRYLHIFMIALCVAASIALYIITATFYKAVIATIIVAYTVFITLNSQLIRLIFQMPYNQDSKKYQISRPWTIDQQTSKSKKIDSKESDEAKIKTIDKQQEQLNTSSVQQSFDMRDVSMSVYKAVNSEMYESRFNSSRKTEIRNSYGLDLDDLSLEIDRVSQKSILKSKFGPQKTIIIQDRKSIARESSLGHREQNQRQYQLQLRMSIKKGVKQVQARYKFILSIIQRLVSPIVADNCSNTQKLKEIFLEFLDIIFTQQNHLKENVDMIAYGTKSRPITTTFQYCLFQTYMLSNGHIRSEQFDIPLKLGKSIRDFQKKCQELIKARIKIAESLGVNCDLMGSKNANLTKQFILLYNQYIQMIIDYMERELPNKNKTQKQIDLDAQDHMDKQFQNKLYILYLVIKDINSNLKFSNKIKFTDYLNFHHPKNQNYQLEVYPKVMFDAFTPHFNIYKLNDERRELCYNCQPGENNYLSVIYFLMYSLSLKPDLLSWNSVIYRYVHEIL